MVRTGFVAVALATLTSVGYATASPLPAPPGLLGDTPKPPGTGGSTFKEEEAKKELMAARIRATECSHVSGVTGSGKLRVSIGNSGQVTEIVMLQVPPGMDEKTDQCVKAEFNKVRVTPFEGDTVNVTGAFVLL
jgi:hypothetical protein